jgi:hypothetical protein
MRTPVCALARLIPISPATEDELRSMRAAAWHKQGVLVVSPAMVTDSWEKAFLESIASRLYGRRSIVTGGTSHGH